ncbi:MAG: hypothetical protein M8860_11030 [marine benthic group bacterium]|nr:hypothetical protein [Candidatus Carthagonibacter metallireducens]
MPDSDDRDRRDDRKKKLPRPLGPRRKPGRPGDRKGPRPARDISAAPAVGARRPEEGEDARDSKGRKRGRPARSAPREGKRPSPTPVGRTSGDLTQVVQVMFKGVRTDYYTFRGDAELRENEFVVVEADRGQDLGWVKRAEDAGSLSCDAGCEHDHEHHPPVALPARKILRRAAPVDVERRARLMNEEPEIRRRTRELVARHELKMKISEAEWQWDRNKLTVYFTAEKRVDFRGLVKDMARTFKTRIELRQIGVRDEAKRLGGIGRCGRELCCRLWLPRIEPVTLQLAKDQGLSLNPAQISGACGRLMSCLHYEHEVYVQARKRFPKVGKILRTSRGEEKVTGWDLFRDTVALRTADGDERTIPLDELKLETSGARDSKA